MPGNRTKKAKAWLYFEDLGGEGRCNFCKKIIKAKGGTTSNMIKHLTSVHKEKIKINEINPSKVFPPLDRAENSTPKDEISMLPPLPALPNMPALPDMSALPDMPGLDTDQNDWRNPTAAARMEEVQSSQDSIRQPTISTKLPAPFVQAAAAAKRRKLSPADSNEIARQITRYIVLSMQPFSTIENVNFRAMLHALCPEYSCPNRSTLSDQYVPAWYDQVKTDLIRRLSKVDHVSLTSDGWTSITQDHYLTVTISFIENWRLETKVLSTKAVFVSQTGEAVSLQLDDICREFGVRDKIRAVTVDNAANMDVAISSMHLLKIGCFTHTLHLAVQKVYDLPAVRSWLPHIRSVVVWFRRVSMAKVVLRDKQVQTGIPSHDLILDCRTRWNSLYEMLQRFIEQYPALVASTLDPRLKKTVETEKLSNLSNEDLSKAEQFIAVFGKLRDITNNMSGQTIPTIGSVLPLIARISKHLTPLPEDRPFTREIKKCVFDNLETRYKKPEVREFLEEATLLDPRFKSIRSDSEDIVWQRLKAKTMELFPAEPETHVKVKKESDADNIKTEPESETQSQTSNLQNIFDDSDSDNDTVEITGVFAPPTLEQTIVNEFTKYKAMGKISKLENPLTFWNLYSGVLPHLSQMALKYLCVQASSVPSERVFSTAGDTVTAERSRLDPCKVDMVIFLKKNA